MIILFKKKEKKIKTKTHYNTNTLKKLTKAKKGKKAYVNEKEKTCTHPIINAFYSLYSNHQQYHAFCCNIIKLS